jgi:hypothetical protein
MYKGSVDRNARLPPPLASPFTATLVVSPLSVVEALVQCSGGQLGVNESLNTTSGWCGSVIDWQMNCSNSGCMPFNVGLQFMLCSQCTTSLDAEQNACTQRS